MPILGTFLYGIFTALAALLVRFMAALVAVRIAAVVAMTAAATALMVAFHAFVEPLVAALFSTAYGQFLGLLFPPISGNIVAGMIGLWVACTAYRLNIQAIRTVTNVG